jgi:hypothetical protein
VIKPAHFLVPQLSNSVASKTIGDIIQRIGLTALLVFVVSEIVSMLVISATLPFGEEKARIEAGQRAQAEPATSA